MQKLERDPGKQILNSNFGGGCQVGNLVGDGPAMGYSGKRRVGTAIRQHVGSAIADRSWEGVPGVWLLLHG